MLVFAVFAPLDTWQRVEERVARLIPSGIRRQRWGYATGLPTAEEHASSAPLANIQDIRQLMTRVPGGQTTASAIAPTPKPTGQIATGVRDRALKLARIARVASSAPQARVHAHIARWAPLARPMGRTASHAKLANIQDTRQWTTRVTGTTTASAIVTTPKPTGQIATGARNYRWKLAQIARAGNLGLAPARVHAKIAPSAL